MSRTKRKIFGAQFKAKVGLVEGRRSGIKPAALVSLIRQRELAGVSSAARTRSTKFIVPVRGVVVTRPNQVWSTDITYIRLSGGFIYLAAVIDWYSRKVLSFRISNTPDTSFCVGRLEEALQRHSKPDIFNTDQGCQFTRDSFAGVLEAHGIAISMNGCCRALDDLFVERLWRSVKYEVVYLKGHANLMELIIGLTEHFVFYDDEWPHQSLGNRTLAVVCSSPTSGALG